jgi:ferredoxin-nitrite reductase
MGSGGYCRAEPLDAFVTPEEAAETVAAIIRVFRDHGPREARSRSRFAFLVADWGVDRIRAAVEEAAGRALEPAGDDARTGTRTDHVGIYRQRDGRSFVGLVVPGGRMTAAQLAEIARLAETHGTGEVRFTAEQNVLIPNVTDTALRELTASPLLAELPYDPPEVLRGLVVCTGIDFCDLALIDTKARAIPMTRTLAARLADRKEPLRIHWSGCPASCANHQLADIGFEGTKVRVDGKVVEAVDVWVGGRSGPDARPGQRIMEGVPLTEVPVVLEYLARHFPKQRPARPAKAA